MRAIIRSAFIATFAWLAIGAASWAQTPPAGPPGTVTLPLGEYDRLVDRAARPPQPPERPPVAAVVARAEMVVHANAMNVRGTITMNGEVLRQGRVKVPIVSDATLIDVQQGGAAVPVVNEGGTISAILSGPGPFALSVSFGADVATEPGRASALLPAVRAGTVRGTVDTPGDNTDVRIDRGLIGLRSSSGGKTTVDVTFEPGAPSRISWSSRDQAVKPSRELRVISDVKTLITVAESDLRVASLFDVNVLQGEPSGLELQVPDGFDVVSVSGATVETAGQQAGRLSLAIRDAARKRHSFLVTLERNVASGVQHGDIPVPGVRGTQRETGEVAWEAVGTVDLTATEAGALRRLDVSEVNRSLSSLARSPLLAAFRYQRRGDDRVPVAFDVRRFADAPVLGALAQSAQVTTLVSTEGRTLTEFRLWLRNRGQLFLKVGLPKGSTLLTAEVGGEPVKPVDAPDGARVPLTRSGFQPSGSYLVSFVYVEPGTSFDKKGDGHMKLPRVDVPIAYLEWEVFLPDRYKVKRFDGDAMPLELTARAEAKETGRTAVDILDSMGNLRRDELGGVVVDGQGGVLPGATVIVQVGSFRRAVTTGEQGTFRVSGLPSGRITLTAELQGFKTYRADLASGGQAVRATLEVGSLAETVQVTAASRDLVQNQRLALQAPSENVTNLQRRVSGVLPVRIDIPRTGQSFSFVRPLVLDEETALRFEYRLK